MNAKQLIAAMAVLAAAGSAFAGDVNPFPAQEPFVSQKTRAEVNAELAQARAHGWVTGGDALGYPGLPVASRASTAAGSANEHHEQMMNACVAMMKHSS